MMFGLVLTVHVVLSLFLIGIILLQGGRGGLGEALGGAAAQSLFGGGANTVMTKITAVGAGLFMVTCLSLAMLSTARGRSIVERVPSRAEQLPLALPPEVIKRAVASEAPAAAKRAAAQPAASAAPASPAPAGAAGSPQPTPAGASPANKGP